MAEIVKNVMVWIVHSALTPPSLSSAGEKPFLCDKCGRGFNRVDNLRSHVKTVHHGKAGMKRLVVAGSSGEEDADVCPEASTSEEISIVTVSSDDIVTLATSVVAQLTGQATYFKATYFEGTIISLDCAELQVLPGCSCQLDTLKNIY